MWAAQTGESRTEPDANGFPSVLSRERQCKGKAGFIHCANNHPCTHENGL